jgi:hypothetical protein
MKVSTVPLQPDERLRDLCRQAMSEEDLTKLLSIFLELDQAVEQEQRRIARTT